MAKSELENHFEFNVYLNVAITIVVNWASMTFGDMLELYDYRKGYFWETLLFTFPLIISIALSVIWLVLSWRRNVKAGSVHVMAIVLIFFGTTWLSNYIALIPVQYEFVRQGHGLSNLVRNLIGLMEAYFQAYQPLNFVLATATGLYWGFVLSAKQKAKQTAAE